MLPTINQAPLNDIPKDCIYIYIYIYIYISVYVCIEDVWRLGVRIFKLAGALGTDKVTHFGAASLGITFEENISCLVEFCSAGHTQCQYVVCNL